MTPRRRDFAATLLLVPVVAGVVLFALPIAGLVARVPWGRLEDLLSPAVRDAMSLSLVVSLMAAIVACVIGLPLAAWLAAGDSFARRCVRVLVTLPLVLPPVVGGVALLAAFGRNGIVGSWLARWFDVVLPFSTAGVVLAASYVAMPFFVLTAEAGLRAFDRRYADAAATLGAGRWRRACTVTLPMIAPSLGAGLVVAWARALGEFGATVTFAGSLGGTTRTMPLEIFVALQTQPEAALTMSLLLAVVSAVILFLLRERWFPARSSS